MARTSRASALFRRVPYNLAAALILVAAHSGVARAQVGDHLLVKGLLDMGYFKTDPGSVLLSKNGGDGASVGQLRLMAAADFTAGLQGFFLGSVEGVKGSDEKATQFYLDETFVRYSFEGRSHVMVDLGKVALPFGNFSKRNFSSVNPLIGEPDGYNVSYPLGLVVSGRASKLDYRFAMLDKPPANEKYVPKPGRAIRPAFALGFTPMIGMRVGGYFTAGPYLGSEVEPALPAGAGWKDFGETVFGIEAEYSRGYFELNADVAFSSYEVPTHSGTSRGQAWFIEPKYSWTPRFFTALRLERNDYPYIQPVSSAFWIAQNALFYDVEVGAGWRFTPDLIVKASYRKDQWEVDDSMQAYLPDGYSAAVQLSYSFNVNSWLERPK